MAPEKELMAEKWQTPEMVLDVNPLKRKEVWDARALISLLVGEVRGA